MSLIISLHERNPQQNLCLLPPDQVPTFQNPEIHRISRSYFCVSKRDTDDRDVERPSKRARLDNAKRGQTMIDVRSVIVSKIYSLLGLQFDTTLAGLSQNVL